MDDVKDDGREALAEDSEALIAAAMSHNVDPVVLKGGEVRNGKGPRIFIVGKGAITQATTPEGLLRGMVHVQTIRAATQDGERPTMFACGNCAALRPVPRTGTIPKRCKDCYARSERERACRTQKANPGAQRAR
jgi:hypothetical protein